MTERIHLFWSRDDEGVITIYATDENTGRIAEVADFWTKPMRERLGFRREYAKGVQQQLAETLVWNWNGPPGGDLDPSEELDRPGSEREARLMGERNTLAAEVTRLREQIAAIVDAYDRATPMRTADWHGFECDCLRCAVDRARAALAEGGRDE